MFYHDLKKRFEKKLEETDLAGSVLEISSRILSAEEAIGVPKEKDYPILKGKEYLVEAVFRGSKGQAYTDEPLLFSGTLKEIVDLPLDITRNRCIFVSAINAVLRFLGDIDSTVHCRDEEPKECSARIAEFVSAQGWKSVGLIGLQPAILRALAASSDKPRIICLDRDEEFRGQSKSGVPIIWSDEESLKEMFSSVQAVLATGSTIVNGTLPDILSLSEKFKVPVSFYGTTIAGAAYLMGLNRICYNAS